MKQLSSFEDHCEEKINHVLVSLDHDYEADLVKVKILQQVSADLIAAVSKNVTVAVDLIGEMMEKPCKEQVLSFMKDLDIIQQDSVKVQKVNGVHKAQLKCTTYTLKIRRRVSAVIDGKLMTYQEVCTALEEWTEVKSDLEICKEKLEAVFCNGGYEFADMHLLEMFLINHTAAKKEVSKLIALLSVKKDECSRTVNGTFVKDVRKMVSGFNYSASNFDIKSPDDVEFDISCLLDNGKARKVAVQRLFGTRSKDVDLIPSSQYLMKQVKVSQIDDEDVSQSLSCHNGKVTAKKDVTAVDELTM